MAGPSQYLQHDFINYRDCTNVKLQLIEGKMDYLICEMTELLKQKGLHTEKFTAITNEEDDVQWRKRRNNCDEAIYDGTPMYEDYVEAPVYDYLLTFNAAPQVENEGESDYNNQPIFDEEPQLDDKAILVYQLLKWPSCVSAAKDDFQQPIILQFNQGTEQNSSKLQVLQDSRLCNDPFEKNRPINEVVCKHARTQKEWYATLEISSRPPSKNSPLTTTAIHTPAHYPVVYFRNNPQTLLPSPKLHNRPLPKTNPNFTFTDLQKPILGIHIQCLDANKNGQLLQQDCISTEEVCRSAYQDKAYGFDSQPLPRTIAQKLQGRKPGFSAAGGELQPLNILTSQAEIGQEAAKGQGNQSLKQARLIFTRSKHQLLRTIDVKDKMSIIKRKWGAKPNSWRGKTDFHLENNLGNQHFSMRDQLEIQTIYFDLQEAPFHWNAINKRNDHGKATYALNVQEAALSCVGNEKVQVLLLLNAIYLSYELETAALLVHFLLRDDPQWKLTAVETLEKFKRALISLPKEDLPLETKSSAIKTGHNWRQIQIVVAEVVPGIEMANKGKMKNNGELKLILSKSSRLARFGVKIAWRILNKSSFSLINRIIWRLLPVELSSNRFKWDKCHFSRMSSWSNFISVVALWISNCTFALKRWSNWYAKARISATFKDVVTRPIPWRDKNGIHFQKISVGSSFERKIKKAAEDYDKFKRTTKSILEQLLGLLTVQNSKKYKCPRHVKTNIEASFCYGKVQLSKFLSFVFDTGKMWRAIQTKSREATLSMRTWILLRGRECQERAYWAVTIY